MVTKGSPKEFSFTNISHSHRIVSYHIRVYFITQHIISGAMALQEQSMWNPTPHKKHIIFMATSQRLVNSSITHIYLSSTLKSYETFSQVSQHREAKATRFGQLGLLPSRPKLNMLEVGPNTAQYDNWAYKMHEHIPIYGKLLSSINNSLGSQHIRAHYVGTTFSNILIKHTARQV